MFGANALEIGKSFFFRFCFEKSFPNFEVLKIIKSRAFAFLRSSAISILIKREKYFFFYYLIIVDSKFSNSDLNKAQNIHNMNVRDRAGVLNQIPSFSTM